MQDSTRSRYGFLIFIVVMAVSSPVFSVAENSEPETSSFCDWFIQGIHSGIYEKKAEAFNLVALLADFNESALLPTDANTGCPRINYIYDYTGFGNTGGEQMQLAVYFKPNGEPADDAKHEMWTPIPEEGLDLYVVIDTARRFDASALTKLINGLIEAQINQAKGEPPLEGQILFTYDNPPDALVASGHWKICVVNADGSGLKLLPPSGDIKGTEPQWSRNGEKIAFVPTGWGPHGIHVMNADGGDLRQVTNGYGDLYPQWSPKEDEIVFITHRDFIQSGSTKIKNAEIYTTSLDGTAPRNLTNSQSFDGWKAKWSPDGRRIAFTSKRGNDYYNLFLMDPDGQNVVRLTDRQRNDHVFEWSPDNSRIVFQSDSDSPGAADIFIVNVDGSDLKDLSSHPAVDSDPKWSPDGTHIVFSSDRDENQELYLMEPDGTHLRKLTHTPDADEKPIQWSPDGRWILYEFDDHDWGPQRRNQLKVIAIDGSGTKDVTDDQGLKLHAVWR